MTIPQLKNILKIGGVKKYSNKNKNELIKMVVDADADENFKHVEAKEAIQEMRKAMGLSIHGNTKNPLKGIRKNKKDDAKSAKDLADEALGLVKKALKLDKPKLKKQFINRIMKEMADFEKEVADINEVPKKTMNKVKRVSERERVKDSAKLKQDI